MKGFFPVFYMEENMSTLYKISSSSISVAWKAVNETVAFGWKIK